MWDFLVNVALGVALIASGALNLYLLRENANLRRKLAQFKGEEVKR